jgi:hypothetical protein
MEYLTGHHKACLDAVNQVLEHGTSLGDKFRAHLRMLDCVAAAESRNYAKGTWKSIEVLVLYDVKIPLKASYSWWQRGSCFEKTSECKRLCPMESWIVY